MTGPRWRRDMVRPGIWEFTRSGDELPTAMVSFDGNAAHAQAVADMLLDILNRVDLDARVAAAPPEDRPFIARGWPSHAAYVAEREACQLWRAELPPADVLRARFAELFRSPDHICSPDEMRLWQSELERMIADRHTPQEATS